jgi:hypothetical protein
MQNNENKNGLIPFDIWDLGKCKEIKGRKKNGKRYP